MIRQSLNSPDNKKKKFTVVKEKPKEEKSLKSPLSRREPPILIRRFQFYKQQDAKEKGCTSQDDEKNTLSRGSSMKMARRGAKIYESIDRGRGSNSSMDQTTMLDNTIVINNIASSIVCDGPAKPAQYSINNLLQKDKFMHVLAREKSQKRGSSSKGLSHYVSLYASKRKKNTRDQSLKPQDVDRGKSILDLTTIGASLNGTEKKQTSGPAQNNPVACKKSLHSFTNGSSKTVGLRLPLSGTSILPKELAQNPRRGKTRDLKSRSLSTAALLRNSMSANEQ